MEWFWTNLPPYLYHNTSLMTPNIRKILKIKIIRSGQKHHSKRITVQYPNKTLSMSPRISVYKERWIIFIECRLIILIQWLSVIALTLSSTHRDKLFCLQIYIYRLVIYQGCRKYCGKLLLYSQTRRNFKWNLVCGLALHLGKMNTE